MSQIFFSLKSHHILFKDTFLITELSKKRNKNLCLHTFVASHACYDKKIKYIDKLEMIFIL